MTLQGCSWCLHELPEAPLSRKWVMVGWHILEFQPQPRHSCHTKVSLWMRPLQRSSEQELGVWEASSLRPFPSAGARTSPRILPVPPASSGRCGRDWTLSLFFFKASALTFRPSPSSRSRCISLPELPSSPAPPEVSALPLYPTTPGVSSLSLFPPRPWESSAAFRCLPGALPSPRPVARSNPKASGLAHPRPPETPRPPAPPRGGLHPPCARSHWLRRRRAGPLCDVTISCRKVPICAGERCALGRTAGSAVAPAPAPHRHYLSAFRRPGHAGPVSPRGTRSGPRRARGLGAWGLGLGGLARPERGGVRREGWGRPRTPRLRPPRSCCLFLHHRIKIGGRSPLQLAAQW